MATELDIRDDSLEGRIRALEEAQRATINILEDFDVERAKLEHVQRAMFNILQDFGEEKDKLEKTHRATLNILEDFDQEKRALETGLRATFNILEDFTEEKLRLEQVQRGTFNILDDLDEETSKLEAVGKELARSNADLEQFAYVASHDLQEPLRMVSSYTQLLARRYKGKFDPDADEIIAYAVDGASRMQALINDLLSYSRVGTKGKDPKPTDVQSVFDQALANLQAAIQESGAVVTHNPLPTVMADGSQFVQLLQNLIGNAIKFRGQAPPRVHVSATRKGNEWTFSVHDNGIGIDPKYFDRLFVVFRRLHNRAEYPGTGIGLAVCKRIVERHGGRIWVESEPSKGSTFYFTIPERGSG